MVDWETIAIYACSNPDCCPDFDKDEYYDQQFSYVQFSKDLQHVRYGSEAQIAEQKKQKSQQQDKDIYVEEDKVPDLNEAILEEFKKQDEESAQKKKNKKRKNKKK